LFVNVKKNAGAGWQLFKKTVKYSICKSSLVWYNHLL